ncbi:hypothetical protein EMIT0215P_50084 [Pseudomonas serboccidentalis]
MSYDHCHGKPKHHNACLLYSFSCTQVQCVLDMKGDRLL